ncbi:MAG TPA: DUF2330 domain-containing protein [Acidimicrobiales bacterium]|nr:DUF2330 domain-containing protein [Acidimicrobiales bacterium]
MARRRFVAAVAMALPVAVVLADPAGACGGLVGENGTIELTRTTTLAAYTDGVERYVTAFEFSGEGESVGSIVPLPDVPTDVTRAGDWTLQRLAQEVAPPAVRARGAEELALTAQDAEVVLETQVDALDTTVLRGGGDEVGRWALENGFLLTPDAPEVLDHYARRSPVFMAARFDAQRAEDLGQGAGDSTPIMATIPTDDPWVPVHILGLGLDDERAVEADVFLLTDEEPQLLAGGDGLTVARSEQASPSLLADLRSDVGMAWVPRDMWLSYLQLDAPAGELDYDLAVSTTPGVEPSLADAGVDEPAAAAPVPEGDGGSNATPWPLVAAVAGGLVLAGGVVVARRRSLSPAAAPASPSARAAAPASPSAPTVGLVSPSAPTVPPASGNRS